MPDLWGKLMVTIVHTTPPLHPGDWWYEDNGLPVPPPEPTPVERALGILDAELRHCPLYQPTYPRGGVLPSSVGATADRPPVLRGPNWKA